MLTSEPGFTGYTMREDTYKVQQRLGDVKMRNFIQKTKTLIKNQGKDIIIFQTSQARPSIIEDFYLLVHLIKAFDLSYHLYMSSKHPNKEYG